ncbi:MAG: 2-amino-4-hydroxy-6-hydroxymethyldihydropteridine diphosphokinase [Ardenticatenaceae bacterium]|nr:2-amino-4-hydroxy-6-hydroxymethyldihydropteridine diphosphokinase [Ardenticatenaceae bacterium]
MSQIYLSLGTNLGDRPANLQKALSGLQSGVAFTAVSAVYETEPWGVADQPAFLNICAAGTTALTPFELLQVCKSVETQVGRRPTYKWGPRLIDIDILFYDDLILDEDTLIIPHPFVEERAFVLAPLADIAPDFVHPQTGETVVQMLAQVYTTAVHRLSRQPLLLEVGD